MKITENPVASEELLTRAEQARDQKNPRAPGLHASDLIFCLRKGWYKHVGKYRGIEEPVSTFKDRIMWMAGNGHHAILEAVGAEPGVTTEASQSMNLSDIMVTATPDMIDLDHLGQRVMCEIKSTRKSSAAKMHEMGYYLEQLASYMLFWNIPRGRLIVLFLMGDYKAERTPIMKTWDIELSPGEMAAWQREVVRRARLMTDETMPIPERYGWECSYCPYASAKGGPCTWDEMSKGRDGDKSFIKQSGFFELEVLA